MGSGSGHGKRLNPGRMGVTMSRNVKTSIVEIRNSDELCCARAIITMKARAELEIVMVPKGRESGKSQRGRKGRESV